MLKLLEMTDAKKIKEFKKSAISYFSVNQCFLQGCGKCELIEIKVEKCQFYQTVIGLWDESIF